MLSELPLGVECFEISKPRYWLQPVSPTFHGRDVFAPVAAHASAGVPLADLGRAVGSIRVLPFPRPEALEDGDLLGHVLHIDHFGNIITDIQRDDLPPEQFRLQAGHRKEIGRVGGQRLILRESGLGKRNVESAEGNGVAGDNAADEVRRVGGESTARVDVRILAATHRDLKAMVSRGEFRLIRMKIDASQILPIEDFEGIEAHSLPAMLCSKIA